MLKTCKNHWCQQSFEVTQEDLDFYEKVSPVFNGKKELIPPPTLCPECRQQRRLAFRNDMVLYHRKSDASNRQIVSIYSSDKPYIVYDQDEWWSDQWDELSYGRTFDFSKTFTEQFAALNRVVPHMSLFTTNAENSYFTNHSLNAKNTYLIAGATDIQDSMYGRFIISSEDTVDGLSLYSCRWCYECVASHGCYHCQYATYSFNCSQCFMIDDCQNCKNCTLCFGLKGKQYCLLNEQLSKEEYEQKTQELFPMKTQMIPLLQSKLRSLSETLPHRAQYVFKSESSTGDMVFGSRNCSSCFDCSECEDCVNITHTPYGYDSRDINYTAPKGVRHCYDCCSTVGAESCMATFLMWYGNNVYYSRECHNCSDLFGCSGMKRKRYCILNTQYSKDEYEELVPRIIDHMRSTGEWGEYFHPSLSTMGYNETLAQDYFPLTESDALAQGWKWHEDSQKKDQYLGPKYDIPDSIADVPDDITKQILLCEATGKPYKIIPQELKFYREMGIPIPRKCPDQRHKERMALRNPRKLWNRNCMKCQTPISTSYAPERPEIVYCESCYLETVY